MLHAAIPKIISRTSEASDAPRSGSLVRDYLAFVRQKFFYLMIDRFLLQQRTNLRCPERGPSHGARKRIPLRLVRIFPLAAISVLQHLPLRFIRVAKIIKEVKACHWCSLHFIHKLKLDIIQSVLGAASF